MKIFLDTADLEEIRQGVALGVVDGVTTNPTLVARERKPFREHILEICKIVTDGVVNAEVVSTLPFKVFEQLFQHPLTDRGLARFLKDWEKAQGVLGNIIEPAAARKTGR